MESLTGTTERLSGTVVYTGALDTEPQLMQMMQTPAAIIDAIRDAGGIAIDLTARMGKPAVYVRLPHDRHDQPDQLAPSATMANVARAKAGRRHRKAVASTDPRLPMLTTGGGAQVGRMRYYATRRRPWPANARGPHSGAPCARRMYVFANDPAMRRLVEW